MLECSFFLVHCFISSTLLGFGVNVDFLSLLVVSSAFRVLLSLNSSLLVRITHNVIMFIHFAVINKFRNNLTLILPSSSFLN